MANKLNVYFPMNNLNPQGWISEFITPILSKTGPNRGYLSNLFYNNYITERDPSQKELIKILKQALGTDYFKKFRDTRFDLALFKEEKMLFLNGNHLDLFEVDETLKGKDIEDAELQRYILFMSTIKPYQLAFLQPYLKLYYGYRENKNQDFSWIEFPFSQFYDLDFILSEKTHARAEGSGITNVKVRNKFNIATQVNSDISISYTFGSMKILTQEMNSAGRGLKGAQTEFPHGFSFAKLAANLDVNKEIIKLEYGYKAANGFDKYIDPSLKTIIEKKEKKVYLLNKVGHDFKFDEKGIIELTVKYMNFHDSTVLLNNNIAIPSNKPENESKLDLSLNYGQALKNYNLAKKQISEIEVQIRETKTSLENKTISKLESDQKSATIKDLTEKLAKTSKTFNLLKRSLKADLTTVFLDQIKAQGQLFSINFNTTNKNNVFNINTTINLIHPENGNFIPITTIPSTYDTDTFKKNTKLQKLYKDNKPGTDELLNRVFARIFNAPYDEKEKTSSYGNIMFFPLKALLCAGYSFLDEEEQKEIPYMIFGNTLMKVGDKLCSINIGDLLVESGVFQKWYYNKFYKKDKLEYSFNSFMTDIINDLVPEVLYRNRVGFDDKAPTTAVKQTQFYLKGQVSDQLKNDLRIKGDTTDLKKLSELLSKNPTNKPLPVIYYGQLTNKTTQIASPIFSSGGISEFSFNEIQDSRKGILHIKVGSDGGMMTSIDFKQMDLKYIRSALAAEALTDKASRYFLALYQLGINMMGNNIFSYDSVVCVPSNPLGIDSEVYDPGIAGYYKVKETNDSFDATNKYTTTATADWTFSPKLDDREKTKTSAEPIASVKITDSIPASVNDPINYVIELIENDAMAIINAELQKLKKPEKKTAEKAKKDNSPKPAPLNNVDIKESFGSKSQPV